MRNKKPASIRNRTVEYISEVHITKKRSPEKGHFKSFQEDIPFTINLKAKEYTNQFRCYRTEYSLRKPKGSSDLSFPKNKSKLNISTHNCVYDLNIRIAAKSVKMQL